MAVNALDHYTIVTADLDASVAFYTEVLGLKDGPRPAFDAPGAWLYCDDRPVVHLIGGPGRYLFTAQNHASAANSGIIHVLI